MDGKYVVHLCEGCIKDLVEYYPYIVPRELLRIVEVPVEECDNSRLDDYDVHLDKDKVIILGAVSVSVRRENGG